MEPTEPEPSIDDAESKSLYIFGRDVSQIPCFRSSFLYGITGGIASAFGTFMFTSRPQLGMHVGMGTFTLTTLCYWFHCRYTFSQQKFQYAQLQVAMKTQATFEGTALEEEIEKSAKSV